MRTVARHSIVVGFDLAFSVSAWIAAYWLRFNLDIPPAYQQAMLSGLLWVVPINAAVYLSLRIYQSMWRHFGVGDLRRILLATVISSSAIGAAIFLSKTPDVPRSVLILHPILCAMAMSGSRLAYRIWREYALYGDVLLKGKPVIVLGAGDAALLLLKELKRSEDWRIVGLLDDAPGHRGRWLEGVPILGKLSEVAKYAAKVNVHHAIIAMPSASVAQRRRAAELATNATLEVLTVPAMEDILSGRIAVSQIRRVELEDLLGRDPVQLDNDGLRQMLEGKCILITGAGGSIGSELCRQIARFSPRCMVLFELSEFALYNIQQTLPARIVQCIVGDVKDPARLTEVFREFRPEIVFHAAAYKHVPMMENANAWEAVRNNVQGTLRLAHAAAENGTQEFVLISTDKAVNPTNVMGASKRLAEIVCQVQQALTPQTRFVMVRFGNVLGSSGSVIPRFQQQISAGGPVTVTHPEITRYFMLIPEASQLVLQAGLMAFKENEGGKIYVLEMGEPVKIIDLARDMIHLSGFSEQEIPIEYTGLRPGEKLYEELLASSEATLETPHPKLRVAKPSRIPDPAWLDALEVWLSAPAREETQVKLDLKQLVPEYQPQIEVK